MPSPPIIGTITQPGNGVSTGSVNLTGLPGSGSWTLTITPGNSTVTGSGTTKTISNLAVGTYSISVTNSAGCTSGPSATFEILASAGAPVILITDPAPVCYPSTVDLTNPKITAGSTSGLKYTYWTNPGATAVYATPSAATNGIYYIKGTNAGGSFAIEPVIAAVLKIPIANAGPDQTIVYPSGTTLDAIAPGSHEIGVWSLISGSCEFTDASNARTSVSGLSKGLNILLWTVTNGVCPAASDTLNINVRDKAIPTLITPNMDGKNDYFVVKNPDTPGKLELYIFDRRGVQVYKSLDYNNTWNGVDYNGHQLPEDTYFYILKTENSPAANGYIVVRR
jgi:gliding motility-associated-like protein